MSSVSSKVRKTVSIDLLIRLSLSVEHCLSLHSGPGNYCLASRGY